jgi:hypothetical protein
VKEYASIATMDEFQVDIMDIIGHPRGKSNKKHNQQASLKQFDNTMSEISYKADNESSAMELAMQDDDNEDDDSSK